MKSKIIKAVAILLCVAAIIAPVIFTLSATVSAPTQYGESFFAGLKLKHDRLKAVEGKRIVLIGGSNLAFGVDSSLLQKYTGFEVVNFGLYAALGTKAMLDMAKPYIKSDDIVIICPEEDEQTYSLYYNGLNMWYALDCDYSMLFDVGLSNYDDLLSALPKFAAEKRKAAKRDTPLQSGIYALSSLNEYGDISVVRPYNIMVDFGKGQQLRLGKALVDQEFVDYLNRYAKQLNKKGAEVYFSFSPINKLAIISDQSEIDEFYTTLENKLDFPIISDINDYILDEGYFFDTNFHMNSVGVYNRTALLAEDINKKLGKENQNAFPKYQPSERPDNWLETEADEQDTAHAENFIFEETNGGVAIVGLSPSGQNAERLVVPSSYDGKAVVSIGSEAFKTSSKLTTLVLPENSSIRQLSKRAFAECETLVKIESSIKPSLLSATELSFEGAAADCRVYVPQELFSEYVSDYFWCGMTKWLEISE